MEDARPNKNPSCKVSRAPSIASHPNSPESRLHGYREAGLQGAIRRAFVQIVIKDTPLLVNVASPRAKASSVIKRGENISYSKG